MADYLISRALAGEDWIDAEHAGNYVLGLRPEPPSASPAACQLEEETTGFQPHPESLEPATLEK